jgi:GNAT superfamily N-acetyltransferase
MSAVIRPPREEDVPEIVRLMGEHWPEPVDEDSVRRSWTSPGVELQNDVRLDDQSYAMVEILGDTRVWIDLRGTPSPEIFDWAEARALELGQRLFSGAWSSHESLLRELERRRFRLIRHSHRMEIDLGVPTPEPEWPEGVETRTFRPGDERVFYETERETFADTWEPIEETFEEWEHWMLQPPAFVPDLWFLALAGDEPAGFALCHPHSGNDELGWVRILGVRRPWRRRGLGRALLLHAFSELRQRGFRLAGLGVDAESLTGANRLYEQVGMRVSARFDIYEKTVA